ncbi:MAG: hypothetical protein IPM92_08910 [Saprospiraceae bacterium]|nr:hypothetical protein [Saprospiraceae bacterium]
MIAEIVEHAFTEFTYFDKLSISSLDRNRNISTAIIAEMLFHNAKLFTQYNLNPLKIEELRK